MRVLVTGGAGYIGSVTAQRLLARGHAVEMLDDLSTGHRAAVPAAAVFHELALADAEGLARVFARPFDAVVHFAARSLVGESMARPLPYYRHNVGGTVALLERIAAGGARRCIFSSSAAVYGEPVELPIPEEALLAPVNAYGRTKAAMEWAIADAARAHGFAAVALRYFNAAGADAGRGEDHEPETHLIPRLLRSLLDPAVDFRPLRRGLPHAGRHLHPRLRARDRPRRGARSRARVGGAPRLHGDQPRPRHGAFGARNRRRRRPRDRTRRSTRRSFPGAPATRRGSWPRPVARTRCWAGSRRAASRTASWPTPGPGIAPTPAAIPAERPRLSPATHGTMIAASRRRA